MLERLMAHAIGSSEKQSARKRALAS